MHSNRTPTIGNSVVISNARQLQVRIMHTILGPLNIYVENLWVSRDLMHDIKNMTSLTRKIIIIPIIINRSFLYFQINK